MISLICSVDRNNGIGYQNQLLFSIPDDLQRFKDLTMGHPILMGRNTFDSLPKVLPGRTHYIITRGSMEEQDGVKVFNNLQKMINAALAEDENIFVIGGANLFAQTMQLADKIYLTAINKKFTADTYFPMITPEFQCTEESQIFVHKDVGYQFKEFEKR